MRLKQIKDGYIFKCSILCQLTTYLTSYVNFRIDRGYEVHLV